MSTHQNLFRTPRRKLTTVSLRLDLPSDLTGGALIAQAHGISPYKRERLWTDTNVFEANECDLRLTPADWVHHIALCAIQDKPATQEDYIASLTGGLGIQGEMF